MLRVEVLIGVIASAIAILTFMARAYANIRKGRRIKRFAHGIDRRSTEELERLREELQAAQEMSAQRKERPKDG
jgi:hypothetical protein